MDIVRHFHAVLILISVACGDEEPHHKEVTPENSDIHIGQNSDDNTRAQVIPSTTDDDIKPPKPITGGYLLCKHTDKHTYCRLQNSALDSEKVKDSIDWNSIGDDNLEKLPENSHWHIRMNHDVNETTVEAVNTSTNQKFHYIPHPEEDNDCLESQILYLDRCFTQIGSREFNEGSHIFSNSLLSDSEKKSFSSFFPYPILQTERSSFYFKLDWKANPQASCKHGDCSNYAIYLVRVSDQGRWIRRDVQCFETDSKTTSGSFFGEFEIPDHHSVYYISQPVLVPNGCPAGLNMPLAEPLESFGAIIPE